MTQRQAYARPRRRAIARDSGSAGLRLAPLNL
jgi:hypothetical protein